MLKIEQHGLVRERDLASVFDPFLPRVDTRLELNGAVMSKSDSIEMFLHSLINELVEVRSDKGNISHHYRRGTNLLR